MLHKNIVFCFALFDNDKKMIQANIGWLSQIVAATWDSLDPDNKAAYKKRTEIAKKEYLRALAAYRANMVSKVSFSSYSRSWRHGHWTVGCTEIWLN